MDDKPFNAFYIELEKVFGILETARMAIEKLQETLTIRPYSKEEVIDLYKDIHMYLKAAGLVLEIILDRIEKYGPKDKYLYDMISRFYKELDDIAKAFWNASFTYEEEPTKGINYFYKISMESLRTIGNITEFIARELNL
jgi:hypothetical protein